MRGTLVNIMGQNQPFIVLLSSFSPNATPFMKSSWEELPDHLFVTPGLSGCLGARTASFIFAFSGTVPRSGTIAFRNI